MPRPIAVITGAGSGIGASIGLRLATNHDVILTHLNEDDDFLRVVANAEARGARVITVTGDLTLDATIEEFQFRVHEHMENLQTLVCCAGAYPIVLWNELTRNHLRASLSLNLETHLACIQAVTPRMIQSGYGRIVAISSVLTQIGRVNLAPYIAAKGGLEALVRALARELGPHGVTINIVRPGSIEVASKGINNNPVAEAQQLAKQCIQRRGTPDDIAAAVAFLTSSEAGFITGQCLTVDGGWHFS
ncbi:SDR family oxidoreductase [Nostoc sp. CHAB 5784]|uniref:SDR family NAD(P)-dependent oxidoreductase n=1 Tax=Nostoc mirabile TaxID=2907820 RepID=UPI001E4AC1FF|nr:SDR family oxidoreductase [Nostoc mirabile]MCC5669493.1 SDR family oxidoreductase [Nostoc mirabile CHAB5784]